MQNILVRSIFSRRYTWTKKSNFQRKTQLSGAFAYISSHGGQKIWGCYSNVAIVWLITTGVPRRALCESKIQIFKMANSNEILVILDNN